MAVGQPGYANSGGFEFIGTGLGQVTVYEYTGGIWETLGNFNSITGENTNDRAGYSVALNAQGNIVAEGETGWNGGNNYGPYVYFKQAVLLV